MRVFLLSLSAISLLLLPSCDFRSSTSETGLAPVSPVASAESRPAEASAEFAEQLEPATVDLSPESEFAHDPAPAPPAESAASAPEQPTAQPTSAEDVLQSVARVLQGAAEGTDGENGEGSQSSVFGSIGRALSKGLQEAVTNENTAED